MNKTNPTKTKIKSEHKNPQQKESNLILYKELTKTLRKLYTRKGYLSKPTNLYFDPYFSKKKGRLDDITVLSAIFNLHQNLAYEGYEKKTRQKRKLVWLNNKYLKKLFNLPEWKSSRILKRLEEAGFIKVYDEVDIRDPEVKIDKDGKIHSKIFRSKERFIELTEKSLDLLEEAEEFIPVPQVLYHFIDNPIDRDLFAIILSFYWTNTVRKIVDPVILFPKKISSQINISRKSLLKSLKRLKENGFIFYEKKTVEIWKKVSGRNDKVYFKFDRYRNNTLIVYPNWDKIEEMSNWRWKREKNKSGKSKKKKHWRSKYGFNSINVYVGDTTLYLTRKKNYKKTENKVILGNPKKLPIKLEKDNIPEDVTIYLEKKKIKSEGSYTERLLKKLFSVLNITEETIGKKNYKYLVNKYYYILKSILNNIEEELFNTNTKKNISNIYNKIIPPISPEAGLPAQGGSDGDTLLPISWDVPHRMIVRENPFLLLSSPIEKRYTIETRSQFVSYPIDIQRQGGNIMGTNEDRYIFLPEKMGLEEYYEWKGFTPVVEKISDLNRLGLMVDYDRDQIIPPDDVLDAYSSFNEVFKHNQLQKLELMVQAIRVFTIGQKIPMDYLVYFLLRYPFSKVFATVLMLEAYYIWKASEEWDVPYVGALEGPDKLVKRAGDLVKKTLEREVPPVTNEEVEKVKYMLIKALVKSIDVDNLWAMLSHFEPHDQETYEQMIEVVESLGVDYVYGDEYWTKLADWFKEFINTALRVWYHRVRAKNSPIVKYLQKRGEIYGEKSNIFSWDSAIRARVDELYFREGLRKDVNPLTPAMFPFGLGGRLDIYKRVLKNRGQQQYNALITNFQFLAWETISNILDEKKFGKLVLNMNSTLAKPKVGFTFEGKSHRVVINSSPEKEMIPGAEIEDKLVARPFYAVRKKKEEDEARWRKNWW